MSNAVKLAFATLGCLAMAIAGWYLHRPSPFPERTPTEEISNAFDPSTDNGDPSDDALSKRIAALDPFGLSRTTSIVAPVVSTGTTETIEWHLAALVVRPTERYLILAAQEQIPLKIAEGGKLPNGDRVKSIGTHQAVLQSPQGRTRTLYLTEP